jgi:hypothetical protein
MWQHRHVLCAKITHATNTAFATHGMQASMGS